MPIFWQRKMVNMRKCGMHRRSIMYVKILTSKNYKNINFPAAMDRAPAAGASCQTGNSCRIALRRQVYERIHSKHPLLYPNCLEE